VRLFVAVRPPSGSVPGVRTPHITLCFLGDVPDERVPEVEAALRAGLAGTLVCDATIEAGPNRRLGPRAIVRPVSGLDAVAADVRAAVGGFAARPEDRPFRGHLTIARRRRGEPAPNDGQVSGDDGPAEPVHWRVEEIALVRSELGGGDGGTAHHEDVAVVRLRSTVD
jgi:2'-5' RNA ligase